MNVTSRDLKHVKKLVEENKIVEAANAYINVFRNIKRMGKNKFKSCRKGNNKKKKEEAFLHTVPSQLAYMYYYFYFFS